MSKRERELLERAEMARDAIRQTGLDPELALSYVIEPGPLELEQRQREASR